MSEINGGNEKYLPCRDYFKSMKPGRFYDDVLRRGTFSHRMGGVPFSIKVSVQGAVIVSLHLGEAPARSDDRMTDPFMITVRETLIAFLNNEIKDLSHLPLDLSRCAPFERDVLLAARTIPWGKTISYAGLAMKAGHPGAARAAASAMRNNPFPLIIPCHRVIRSNGSIGGFMGKTAGKEIGLKLLLLEREGVRPGK
jgi:methylated-DNA-[protein]-cysteine S-methyltransferase